MRILPRWVGNWPVLLATTLASVLTMAGCGGSSSTSNHVTATPTFSPGGGAYNASQTVTISDSTQGAVLYCTTDGTTPSSSSQQCSQPTTVFKSQFLQAIAIAPGMSASAVASAGYTIDLKAVATPTFSPAGGTFTSAQTVTINDATSGANIYYTTDASVPTTSSTLYTGAISVASSETLSAIAAASGYNTSGVASAGYTISAVPLAITGISPNSVPPGGTGFTLTVNGTDFLQGATVLWNSTASSSNSVSGTGAFRNVAIHSGNSVSREDAPSTGTPLTTTFVSSTELQAAVPASLVASAESITLTVANPDGTTSGNAPTDSTFAVGVPTLTTISPTLATAGGAGFTLTVNGTNFASGAAVQWGSTPLTATLVSATQLTAAIPASLIATAGTANVTVTDSAGTTSGATFTISAPNGPAITGLSPTSATAGGAAFTLTVNGSNFVSGATVNWGSTALTTTFVNSGQLTAAVPASLIATAGTASVTVAESAGTSQAATFTIGAAVAPVITSLSPTSATAGGAAFTLTVNGSNFVSGATVNWGSTALTTTFVNSGQIAAAVPASLIATAGTANIVVSESAGRSSAAVFTINAAPPVITSLSPASVTAGGAGFTLTVNGSNFVSGAQVNWGSTALTTTLVNSGQLTAAVPASLISTAGTASVTVSESAGTSQAATFTIGAAAAPVIASLSPTSATAGGAAFTLTVNGSNFASGAQVNWGSTALTTSFVNSGQLTAAVPASLIATAGTESVTVSDAAGQSSAAVFTINAAPPSITSLSPASVTAGGAGFTLTVNGSNFASGAQVNWGSTALTTSFVNSGQLTAAVPASLIATAGTPNITVSESAGASSAATFTISAPGVPTISTLSPTSATATGAGFTLTVNGSNYVSGAVVNWNGTPLTTSLVNSGQLTASVPASDIALAGTASITVSDSAGTSAAATFTINPTTPVVSSLSQTSATAGASAITLTVNGANFVSPATVNWGSTSNTLTAAAVTPTQLTVTVPASDLLTSGTVSITVTDAGGTSTTSATFTINAAPPSISTLSPTSATAGGTDFTLTVNGANFVSGAQVNWGSTALTTSFVNSGQLTAVVPASLIATAGTASITVSESTGTSPGVTFAINAAAAPAITTLQPNSATAGGAAFTLTVNGSGFVSGAQVNWGSTALTTSFVNSGQLTAAVPASLIATAGTASITVSESAVTSTGAAFTINAANAPTISSNGFSPASATAGGAGFTLTVTGANFDSTAVVSWNGSALSTIVVSSTQVQAAVPASDIATAGTASITVTTTSGGASSRVSFAINAGVPGVGIISPTSTTAGGQGFVLAVTGTNFVNGAVVNWGNTALTTTLGSSSQLTALVPANLIAVAGTVNITVSDSGGTSAPAVTFTINPTGPTISVIAPLSVSVGGGTFTLTVNGANFISGTAVNWNGAALSTTVVSSGQLTASVPASLIAATGAASITVTDTAGTSSAATLTISAAGVPTMTNISPASAISGGSGFNLQVNGASFASTAVVNWNGTPLSTGFAGPVELQATVPASLIATAGTANITVSQSAGTSVAATFTINPPPPTITGLLPNSATATGPDFPLQVSGTNFVSPATVNWGSTSNALTATVVSATEIQVTVPASDIAVVGTVNVTVTDAGGTSATVPAGTFTIIPTIPTISSVSQNSQSSVTAGGQTFALTVNGANFVSSTVVNWNGTALPTTVVGPTQLTATVPASDIPLSAGGTTVSITVTTPNTGTSNALTFNIDPAQPTISANGFSPSSVAAGGSDFTLTVTGTNFLLGATVNFGSNPPLTATVLSSTELQVTVPAGDIPQAEGTVTITVTEQPGGTSSGVQFSISQPGTPTITQLSPNSATAGGTSFPLTVDGTSFVSGATVNWGSNPPLPATVLSSTELQVTVPASYIATAGTVNVTVTSAGGSSGAATFNIVPQAPTIAGISPAFAALGGADLLAGRVPVTGGDFTLTIYGTNFVQGDPLLSVSWNGTTLTPTFVSATQLAASIPVSMIGTTAGAINVTVTTSGGTSSVAFTVDPYVIWGRVQSGSSGSSLPVTGATVQLYAAGASEYGVGATLQATAPGVTDTGGNFAMSYNTCPPAPGDQLYLAVNTTDGGGFNGNTNPNIALMAALGSCNNATLPVSQPSERVTVNEATTIASAYALSAFATVNQPGVSIASSGGGITVGAPESGAYCSAPAWQSIKQETCNYLGLNNAFLTVRNLVNVDNANDPAFIEGEARSYTPGYSKGLAADTYVVNNSTVPQARINTLANILAACVEDATSGLANCNTLFTNALPFTATGTPEQPVDTLQAALNIALNPGMSQPGQAAGGNAAAMSNLFGLQSTFNTPPNNTTTDTTFNPSGYLTAVPNDWTLALTYTGGGLGLWTGSGSGTWQGVPATATATVPNGPSTTKSLNEIGPTANTALAIDATGDIWVSAFGENSNYYSGGQGIVWPPSIYSLFDFAPMLAEFNNQGAPLTSATSIPNSNTVAYGGISLASSLSLKLSGGSTTDSYEYLQPPAALAIDPNGNLWAASGEYQGDLFTYCPLCASGSASIDFYEPFNEGAYGGVNGLASDGSGNIWATIQNANGALLLGYSTNDTASTLPTELTAPYNSPSTVNADHPDLNALTVDSNANLWFATYNNNTDANGLYALNTVTQVLGSSAFLSTSPNTNYVPTFVADGSGNVYGCLDSPLDLDVFSDASGKPTWVNQSGPYALSNGAANAVTGPRGCGNQLVLDGQGHIFAVTNSSVIDNYNDSPNVATNIDEFTTAGAAISPLLNGYTGTSGSEPPTLQTDFNFASGSGNPVPGISAAIDGSGNLWVLNVDTLGTDPVSLVSTTTPGNVLVEYVGIGAPVATPVSAALKNSLLGVRP